MYRTSTEWNAAVKTDHTAIARIDVQRGETITQFDVLDGAIVGDLDDPIRRSLDCTIIDTETRIFGEMRELLNPFLAVLTPYRGVRYSDGTEEWVPCGQFRCTELDAAEKDGAPVWQLKAFDNAVRSQEELPTAFAVAADLDLPGLIPSLLQTTNPTLSFRIATSSWRSTAGIIRGGLIPWSEGRRIAVASGFDLVIARDGAATTEARIVEADAVPAWEFVEGTNADFWEPSRSSTVDAHPNVIRVVGTNPGATGVYGEAADMDPSSPTYRFSAEYGEHIRTVTSDLVMSNEQATAMARALLSRSLGPQDEVQFTAIPNAALDPGDTVVVTRELLGMNGDRMIVAHFELPLLATEGMPIRCRRSVYTGEATPVRGAP